jgi:hypothetical protein
VGHVRDSHRLVTALAALFEVLLGRSARFVVQRVIDIACQLARSQMPFIHGAP